MKPVLIVWISIYVFNIFARASQPITEKIYSQLLGLVSKCSMSYCSANSRLALGKYPETCQAESCSINRDVEVVKTFAPELQNFGLAGYIGICHKTSEIYVVFRGTQTDSDKITDIEFTPLTYKSYVSGMKLLDWECDNCQVHNGFYTSFSTFMEEPFQLVMELLQRYENYHLTITGHSLGGAWALLAGLEFKTLGFNPLVVSIGQPKISATYTFVDKINSIFNTPKAESDVSTLGYITDGYYRLTHKGDKIPYLPPGYLHAGVEININKKDLPHGKEDMVLMGQGANLEEAVEENDLKKWFFKEHREYFIKVPGCK